MALLERFRSTLPFGADPGGGQPSGDMLGHTPPAPSPAEMPRPRVGVAPLGGSGRANMWGLPQPDEVNPDLVGPNGLRRFNQMYRQDPHVRRLILAAWTPLVAGTWTLQPYGGDDATDLDRQIAQDIWWALNNFMAPNFQEHLLEIGPLLLRSGFLPCEQLWGTVKRDGKTLLMPRSLQVRLPLSIWRWWQDDYGQLTDVGQILPNKPDVIIPASELVYYRLGAEGDNWAGTSLLRHAYKSWFMKDKLEQIDAIGQERKAVGVPIIYPPANADPATKTEVEQVFMNLHMSEAAYAMMPGPKAGSQGAAAIPNQEWLVDIIQFDSSSGAGVLDSIAYHQQGIAASFLTDFLELGHHQVGARATAEVQEDPFLTAVNGALLPPIVPQLNRLVDRIRCLNWEGAEGSPTLQCSLNDEASLAEIANYVGPLVASGVIQVDPELEDWIRQRANMPAANADVRANRQAAQQAGMDAAAELAKTGETPGEEPDPNAPVKPEPKAAAEPAQPKPTPPDEAKGKQLEMPMSGTAASQLAPAIAGCTCEDPDSDGDADPDDDGDDDRDPEGDDDDDGNDGDEPIALDAATEPTAKWFERLLSRDQLQAAFDGCREHIEAACAPAALDAASKLAHQAANGTPMSANDPPAELVNVLAAHYGELYALGHQTVGMELARQRAALTKTLDDPAATGAGATAGARLARARQRGEHSARNIVSRVQEQLGRDQITGLKDATALQTAARQAATAQLRKEALSNTAVSVNDGRADAAVTAPDVVGAFYTSCMDERSCSPCVQADDGTMLSPNDALAVGPPNPDCQGGDFCRCALVWVLSDDPSALAAA